MVWSAEPPEPWRDRGEHLKQLSPGEIQRKFGPSDYWSARQAQSLRNDRWRLSQQLRRGKSKETRLWVIQKLKEHWSPKQIAGRSTLEGPESVSHEYVYSLLYKDKRNGGGLHRLLKRYRKRKQRFGARTYPTGPVIPNRVGIENRPACVERRDRLGDLEGDLVVGYRSSGHILTVVDRQSRYVILRKLGRKKKDPVRVQLAWAIRKFGQAHTLTVDNVRNRVL